MKNIIWKSIPEYVGLYEASSNGEIRRILKAERFRIISPFKDKDGYLGVNLCKNNKPRTHRVSRLIAAAFLENPHKLPIVLHLNDIVDDNRPSNLKWGTSKDNAQDAIQKGRFITGANNPASKPVLQFSLNGDFINEWASKGEAQRKTGIYRGNIGRCCTEGKTAGGFIWKFKN